MIYFIRSSTVLTGCLLLPVIFTLWVCECVCVCAGLFTCGCKISKERYVCLCKFLLGGNKIKWLRRKIFKIIFIQAKVFVKEYVIQILANENNVLIIIIMHSKSIFVSLTITHYKLVRNHYNLSSII